MLAVSEMIKRRKAGKLDNLKSPIGYLASLAGKITAPVESTPTIISPKNIQAAVVPGIDDKLETIKRTAYDNWCALSDETRAEYIERKKRSSCPENRRYPVPFELLARNEFIREHCKMAGIQI